MSDTTKELAIKKETPELQYSVVISELKAWFKTQDIKTPPRKLNDLDRGVWKTSPGQTYKIVVIGNTFRAETGERADRQEWRIGFGAPGLFEGIMYRRGVVILQRGKDDISPRLREFGAYNLPSHWTLPEKVASELDCFLKSKELLSTLRSSARIQ